MKEGNKLNGIDQGLNIVRVSSELYWLSLA